MNEVLDLTFTSTPNPNGNRTEMFLASTMAREEQRESIEALLSGGVHELIYSDLDPAIDRLESIVRS